MQSECNIQLIMFLAKVNQPSSISATNFMWFIPERAHTHTHNELQHQYWLDAMMSRNGKRRGTELNKYTHALDDSGSSSSSVPQDPVHPVPVTHCVQIIFTACGELRIY